MQLSQYFSKPNAEWSGIRKKSNRWYPPTWNISGGSSNPLSFCQHPIFGSLATQPSITTALNSINKLILMPCWQSTFSSGQDTFSNFWSIVRVTMAADLIDCRDCMLSGSEHSMPSSIWSIRSHLHRYWSFTWWPSWNCHWHYSSFKGTIILIQSHQPIVSWLQQLHLLWCDKWVDSWLWWYEANHIYW